MGHRRMFSTFEMDHDQNPNPLHAEQSYVNLGRTRAADNGSSAFPVETIPVGGINFTSQRRSSNEYSSSSSSTESSHRNNPGRRSNEYCSPSISMELPNYQVTISGPTYDTLLHPTAGGSSWHVPPNYADQPSSSHYRHVGHGINGGSVNPTIGDVRGQFKRKRPAAANVVCERGSTSRYYNAASTTDVSITPDFQSEKPQHWPWDPMSAASGYRGSSLSIPGESSQRNVRSQTTLDLELNLPRPHVSSNPQGSQRNVRGRTALDLELNLPPHVSSNPSRQLHPTGRPVNQNDTVDFAGMNAAATTQQWNYIPVSPASQGRILASDTSGFGRAANQFPVGSSSSSGTLEIGGYNNDLTSSRNPVIPPQNLHVPSIQAVRGRGSYAQRALPAYGAASSHPHVGYVPTSENGMHSMPEIYSRHTRPLPIIGWRRSDRSERSGLPYQRLYSDDVDAHDRLVTEGLTMFDRSAIYGSRGLLDQHRDMRLDVDNMSYEELLDLGERIGTVSTGLSNDVIPKCMIETICCSLDHSQDEGTCVICLDEYKDKEVLGTLKNCGHDYHVGCIRKWLSMKNVCPICKAPALKDK